MWLAVALILAAVTSAAAQPGIGYDTGTLTGVVKTNGGVVPAFVTVRATSVANGSETTASSPAATPADIALTPTSVALRAFRRGNETGGRSYVIHYAIADDAGNQASATATVTLPHDKR